MATSPPADSAANPPPGRRRSGLAADLREAVTPRTALLVLGVLLLQLGFILSYVGAFHDPRPHRIPVAVVAPAAASARVVDGLNGLPSQPLQARAVNDEATARRQVLDGDFAVALIVDPAGTTDQVLVASGAGAAVTEVATVVLTEAERSQNRRIAIEDIAPAQAGDARGLSSFYLVIGWIIGGYLVAALLGVARGARPATPRLAAIRLVTMAGYAMLSGIGGALIVDSLLGALTGHLFALWWVGAMIVMAAAAATLALQELLGVLGIGVIILLFVVLGNPSAGGAYQTALLPPFWRSLHSALPNGAGTDVVRRVVYFGGSGITVELIVLAAYIVGGAGIALIGATFRHRRTPVAR